MIYVVLYAVLLNAGLLISLMVFVHKFKKKDGIIDSLKKEKKNWEKQIKEAKKVTVDPNSYNVDVTKTDCQVTISQIDNVKYNNLVDKYFRGAVSNITTSSITFTSPISLPIQEGIFIQTVFTLNGESFDVKAKLMKKQEDLTTGTNIYWAKFTLISAKDQERLRAVMYRKEIETRKYI
ncbi:hypothetical protein QRD89_06205 [Halobacillus sp. ACCC02827]|uniref:hypothetical protein n=1 Tax=Halobacillus sp. ACCC02827 TaxID=3052090 RepID=UPI002570E699|nr:hypothetical protein [Halobacillus sp. ACCC02827]WJE16937.1 hypothetical protein QRD89_06205 [Halobacillus sp. ACCC02827]